MAVYTPNVEETMSPRRQANAERLRRYIVGRGTKLLLTPAAYRNIRHETGLWPWQTDQAADDLAELGEAAQRVIGSEIIIDLGVAHE